MGLTNNSVGKNVVDSELEICRKSPYDKVIAIAGNPNVGKSTRATGPAKQSAMRRADATRINTHIYLWIYPELIHLWLIQPRKKSQGTLYVFPSLTQL